MTTLNVFSDLAAAEDALRLLHDGIAPHRVVLPAKPAVSVLAQSGPDPALAEADVAFGQPDAAAVLDAPRLRWLQVSSAGYTRYDTPEFRREAAVRGLIVTNSSSVYAEPCAEHALAFMLANARQLPVGVGTRCRSDSSSWLELRRDSVLLRNQTVLILGFGAIGTLLVQMLKPFEMKVTAFRRKPRGDEGIAMVSEKGLPEALAQADHVLSILPENAESIRFMDAARFSAMKEGAAFYNIGRGRTVDQEALLAVLRSGHLGAAWLDVTEPEPLPEGHPLLSAPNCFITPHTAGGHRNESLNLVRHFLANFRRFTEGAPLRDRVM